MLPVSLKSLEKLKIIFDYFLDQWLIWLKYLNHGPGRFISWILRLGQAWQKTFQPPTGPAVFITWIIQAELVKKIFEARRTCCLGSSGRVGLGLQAISAGLAWMGFFGPCRSLVRKHKCYKF